MKLDALLQLTEAFDQLYQFRTIKANGIEELHEFDTDFGTVQVIIEIDDYHIDENSNSYTRVDFGWKDAPTDMSVTGRFAKKNTNPTRLFGTIMEIMKHSPLIAAESKYYCTGANKNMKRALVEFKNLESSRASLYKRLATKYASRVEHIQQSHGNGNNDTNYSAIIMYWPA